MNNDLIILTKRLKNKESIINTYISAKELDIDNIDFTFNDDIQIKINAYSVSKEFIFKCNIKTDISIKCARCLKAIIFTIDIKDFIFNYENLHQDMIDISNDIRDAILLEIPSRLICHQGCKGFCPTCKTNLNIEQCKCEEKGFNSPFAKL